MWVGKVPGGAVTALAFAPGGRTLYSGDMQGRVFAWDLGSQSRRELYRRAEPKTGNRGVHHLWPTSDGLHLYLSDARHLLDAFHPEDGPVLTPPEDSWGWWKYLL